MKYEFFDSPVHGVGCVSTQDINKGDIVSTEPYFMFTKDNRENAKSVFKDYYWTVENTTFIINGIGCYSNHSDNNNIEPIFDFIDGKINSKYIKFIAIKDIKKGEELFVNYGKGYWNWRTNNRNNNQAPKQNNGMFFFNY